MSSCVVLNAVIRVRAVLNSVIEIHADTSFRMLLNTAISVRMGIIFHAACAASDIAI
ncbi:hypothetical protein [uncultured Campylobacter sp.]|uniref:hypothetical protein n=1 Tax=uncultured Campylobacter sp. TaxID=218934 RepID=UPI0026310A26|nr:hypothetical protein [uncultured Campylobacter sp.]